MEKKSKIIKWIFKPLAVFIAPALVISVYCATPQKIILPENARYSAYPNGFVRLTGENGAVVDTASVGTHTVTAELFGAMPIKSVQVSVIPQQYVSVSGEAMGVRIYSDGVMVVGVEKGGAARTAGVKKGDIIISVNSEPAKDTETVARMVRENEVNLFELRRGEKLFTAEVRGEQDKDRYSAGIWIRDSTAGIGTMSFCEPETRTFGALGHAICDADTGDIVPLEKGSVSGCRITSVVRGKGGEPGELVGTIGSDIMGRILKNTEMGLYGVLDAAAPGEQLPVATRFQVEEGAAQIMCDIDGEGVKCYEIVIEQAAKNRHNTNKSMVIRVTDKVLLDKTGGIVQGMSGAPIVQHGRFVGAVTHVFVNDPERGYAIFAETMLDMSDCEGTDN